MEGGRKEEFIAESGNATSVTQPTLFASLSIELTEVDPCKMTMQAGTGYVRVTARATVGVSSPNEPHSASHCGSFPAVICNRHADHCKPLTVRVMAAFLCTPLRWNPIVTWCLCVWV